MTNAKATSIASAWITSLSDILEHRDIDAFTGLFLPDGWFRDVLVFGWNNRSLEGHAKIKQYLQNVLPASQFSDVCLDSRPHLQPSFFPVAPNVNGLEVAFTFKAPLIHGRGFANLLPANKEETAWKVLSLYMTVDDFKGHEEKSYESGVYEGHTVSWGEVKAARMQEVESDPQALILGAGQSGMMIAARFKQMNIRALIIDQSPRIADNWRKRYPMLTLHTPRTHHAFLYAPYPDNWPIYTPRDRLASWMEHYAESQDLVIWLSSHFDTPPTYDQSTKRWTVTVNKNGTKVTLHPSHIVVATGNNGKPYIPKFPNLDAFQGKTLHTSIYSGGEQFAGKRVVVIGAGNSSADICQDLAVRGAASVTMVQRSATCVSSAKFMAEKVFANAWAEGRPVDVADFKVAAMPIGLLKKIFIAHKEENLAFDKDMHDALKKAGLNLNYGPDDAGLLLQVFTRGGGYWIDVGCAKLIESGKVKVKAGVEIDRFVESGILFKDGTTLDADVVIFATGFYNMKQSITEVFGSQLIDNTSVVWGLDEECELRGCYRPTGHPGFWYSAGDFGNARAMSKQLALLIKAEELGFTEYANAATSAAATK